MPVAHEPKLHEVPIGTGATGTRVESDSDAGEFDRVVDPKTMVGDPRQDLGLRRPP